MTALEYKNDILRRARRVVIKVGSQILSSREGIEESRFRGLVRELADLHSAKKELVIVSSGARRRRTNQTDGALRTPLLQVR